MAGPLSILTIVGPTAVGKSAYAIKQAEQVGGEIVSVDSRQIYRGFIIGTGQPSAQEQARVPHHLINLLDPTEKITAGHYVRLVHAALAEIISRGKTPILCGGSGLYIRALRLGLAPMGESDPELRREVMRRIQAEGPEKLLAELAEVDPQYAATLHPNNIPRLARALEIWEASGEPPSKERQWPGQASGDNGHREILGVGPVTFDLVGIERSRKELYARIDRRALAMNEAGWLAEVAGLLASGLSPEAHPMQGIGYR
ncbi:MAG: tRNA (adenosine(37)-N6)-dimethylallyltransferase MiaA, partial [Candidatus Marinimicrobia bacterium]|nr:tRNA (adenosine(37)-N6)-dimethylallyltransferase MiaA [Candidatus Neomarinimicrobiota bacterium]